MVWIRRIVTFNTTTFDIIHNVSSSGIIEGSPIISSDEKYSFFVSNKYGDDHVVPEFHIVRNVDGVLLFTESSLANVSYAPLGVVRSVQGGEKNSNDIIVWAEKSNNDRGVVDNGDEGMPSEGRIHYFQLPTDYNGTNTPNGPVSRSGKQINKVTNSPPLIPKHYQGAIFAFQAGRIRGWSHRK